MDFKRYGPDGLLVIAKYADTEITDPGTSHKTDVTFKNRQGNRTVEEKVWAGHARSEKIHFWESNGWKKGVLDNVHGYTERIHREGKPTEALNYYTVGNRRIANETISPRTEENTFHVGDWKYSKSCFTATFTDSRITTLRSISVLPISSKVSPSLFASCFA